MTEDEWEGLTLDQGHILVQAPEDSETVTVAVYSTATGNEVHLTMTAGQWVGFLRDELERWGEQ